MYNSPKCIHETIIRDIVDLISDVSGDNNPATAGAGLFNGTSFKSITKASSNLTLTFPVIATPNTPIESSRMICTAIERKAVTMLQMLFSAICISNSKNAMDHIKKFHTNLNDDFSVDEFIGVVDKLATQESSDIVVVNQGIYERVMSDLKNNTDFYLEENITSRSINSYNVDTSYADGTRVYTKEANDSDFNSKNPTIRNQKDAIDVAKNQVISTDVKKANELVPSLMVIKFVSTGDGIPIDSNVVIGVKAKLQYVDSNDMINRLVIKNKDKNGLLNLLKATTRETSFWKDFVFAIDKAKLDALSSSSRGSSSKIWKLLERRALKSKIKRGLGMTNDASAITSLVIAKEEVDILKKQYQVNLLKPAASIQIMDALNLMTIVINDQVLEKVDFLFDDGSKEYETVSYSHLEREESGNYKKVINLLARSK